MGLTLNDLPDAYIVLDDSERIVGFNPAGEKLLSLITKQVVGKTLAEVCSGQAVFLDVDESYQDEYENAHMLLPDRQVGFAEIKVTALQGLDGEDYGHVMILRTLLTSPEHEMLRALQETTFDLHSSLDLKVVLHNIVERACKLVGTRHGYLVTLRDTGSMEPVVGLGALEHMLNFKVIPGQNMAGMVWKTGRPLFIPDYDQWQGRIEEFQRGLIRAIIGMPLVMNGQVVGVLGIARGVESEVSFSEDDVTVLRRFADLAVLALQNARLFQKAQAEIAYRRKTEIELRNANQVLQFQIERIELLQGQLRELAVRDALTDLFNRRYLEEILRVEFARARRSKTSLAVLLIDCDHLKDINDTYGHKAGDDSLVHIANLIRESIRAGDIACRYGGDEFVVVLEKVTEKTAYERAETLRHKIETSVIPFRRKKIRTSVSIGIAMFPAHGTQGESLLQKADQALYTAKGEGKNLVKVYGDPVNNSASKGG